MELNIHFLNVGHGDSIVIEIVEHDSKYIVIDSNIVETLNGQVNPAYEFLRSRKANRINGLIITHFHQDHYRGIENFLDDFEIESLFIPPVLSRNTRHFADRIKTYREKVRDAAKRTADPMVVSQLHSFARLLIFLADSNNQDKTFELYGREQILRIPGINETAISARVYLPLAKTKGVIYRKLEEPQFDFEPFPEMNDMSIAFSIDFLGKRVLLTGDSTYTQWIEHRRQMRRTVPAINAHFLKVPHHGSHHNNNDDLYQYLLGSTVDKHIFVSANGRSHPHKQLFDLIINQNLKPHCTNLSEVCMASNVRTLSNLHGLPNEMKAFLIHYSEQTPIPCQGDIALHIDNAGYRIENSTGMPCVYA